MKEIIQYLKEEYGEDGWITTDPETFEFFRSLAKPKQEKAPPPPPPKVIPKTITPKKRDEPPPPPPPPKKEPLQVVKEKAGEVDDLAHIKAVIQNACPDIVLIDQIPTPGSTVLFCCEEADAPFIEKVAKAISERGMGTEIRILEGALQLDPQMPLRLLLLPKKRASECKEIVHSAESMKRTWHMVPVLLLEESHLYEQDRYLKKGLWESIKSELGL